MSRTTLVLRHVNGRPRMVPIDEAPPLEASRGAGGQTLVRRYEHTAYALPKRRAKDDPVAKEITDAYPRVDDKGRAVFQSKREIAEFQAKFPRYRWEAD